MVIEVAVGVVPDDVAGFGPSVEHRVAFGRCSEATDRESHPLRAVRLQRRQYPRAAFNGRHVDTIQHVEIIHRDRQLRSARGSPCHWNSGTRHRCGADSEEFTPIHRAVDVTGPSAWCQVFTSDRIAAHRGGDWVWLRPG